MEHIWTPNVTLNQTFNCTLTSSTTSAIVTTEILRYGLPIMVGAGLVGNMFSLLVVANKSMRKTSYSVYVSALAIMDSICLIYLFLRHYFVHQLGYAKLYATSVCNVRHWFISGSVSASAWIVVAMTVERLLAVSKPLEANARFTVSRARLIVISLVLAAYIFYVPALLTYTSGTKCRYENGDDVSGIVDWPWYTEMGLFVCFMVTYAVGPSVLLIALNTMIIIKLKRNTATALNGSGRRGVVKFRDTYRMVIGVSCLYTLCTVPYAAYLLRTPGHRKSYITGNLSLLLFFLNHGVNFAVYVLASRTFRRKARNMFVRPK